MSLLTCVACTTQYALGLNACPHCGSSECTTDGIAVARRFPSFVHVSCTTCGRGPWTVRLGGPHPGLIELPNLFCASCGGQVQVPWPPKEEPMSPKITVHGGASNARDADVSPAADASQPLVGAEADQGHPIQDETAPEEEVNSLEEVASAPDYDGMTLAELREEATSRELPSYGTKAQIVERLREDDTDEGA